MRILPAQTRPPAERIRRRHAPQAGAFARYRPCLRWEFGFTCAFCLLHEADLVDQGVEGTGLMTIEHHVAKSEDSEQIDVYGNCFYACRYCNQSRHVAPRLDRSGRRLLEPCTTAWGEHFVPLGDELRPRADDPDAVYTHETYDLDEPRRIVYRRNRRERVEQAYRAIREYPRRIERLLDGAGRAQRSDQGLLLQAAEDLRASLKMILRDIRRYTAVPCDSDESCRCPQPQPKELPPFLAVQATEVPEFDVAQK